MTELQRDFRKALLSGLFVNLAALALLNNNPWGANPDASEWLLTLAAVNELLGVTLIASPELLLHGGRLWRWFVGKVHVAYLHSRRLLGRHRSVARQLIGRAVEHDDALGVGGAISARPPADASIEEQLAHVRNEIHLLRVQIAGAKAQVLHEIEKVRAQMVELELRMRRAIENAKSEIANARIGLRLPGVGFVILGLVLAWIGGVPAA